MFKSVFKSALVVSVLALHVGCTSLQPISKNCSGSACTASLVAGDEVVINTRNQGSLTLKVQQADALALVGVTAEKPPRTVSVATDDIVNIQKREFSSGKTTAAVVGTGVAVSVVFMVIASVGLTTAFIAAL